MENIRNHQPSRRSSHFRSPLMSKNESLRRNLLFNISIFRLEKILKSSKLSISGLFASGMQHFLSTLGIYIIIIVLKATTYFFCLINRRVNRLNDSYRHRTNIGNGNSTSHWNPLQSQSHLKSHAKLPLISVFQRSSSIRTTRSPLLLSTCEYPTSCINWSKLYMNLYKFLPTEVALLELAPRPVILVTNFH